MVKLILASSSKWRKTLMEMSGLKCEAISSDCEENIEYTTPSDYVTELSYQKASAVAAKVKEGIIIAADTIGYMGNEKFEKPKDNQEAFSMLKKLSGTVNHFITGVTIIDLYQNKTISFTDIVNVKVQDLSDEEISWYINRQKNILDCAGFVADECGALFIEQLDGDYKSMVGLPIHRIYVELKKLGYLLNDFYEGEDE